jgi:very-short-patch-repair endonuclease
LSRDFIRKRSKPVSNAELAILADLNDADLFPETQTPFCLRSTKPDFYFPEVNFAVYLDGEQVHSGHEERDSEIKRLLEKRHGCTVRRISYHAPLTKTRRKEIVAKIVDNVVGLRKMKGVIN